VWCFRKAGRDLRNNVELWLAWKRVKKEISDGTLGTDYDRADHTEVDASVRDAEQAAKDEVWGGYRFMVLSDANEPDGLKMIDLGAGHASAAETLCGRIITALKSQALLNESVGAGYIDRNWPPALKESGAWPLSSLRQSFLDGSLTRLLDPDTVLRTKIVDFVARGDSGLGSGRKPNGAYERFWYQEAVYPEEVAFEAGVFLIKKEKAEQLKEKPEIKVEKEEEKPVTEEEQQEERVTKAEEIADTRTIRLSGNVPPELWNRLGTKPIPKLRSGKDLSIEVQFSATVEMSLSRTLESELRQLIQDLGLTDKILIS
jgi:hypothetical protein